MPMAQATHSLHQATEPFQPISRTAICILARLAAKRIVTAELKDAGVRVTLVKPAEITAKAIEYLIAHPELYDVARERAQRMTAEGVFGKRAQRAYLSSSAQTQSEPNSTTSAVQISSAK